MKLNKIELNMLLNKLSMAIILIFIFQRVFNRKCTRDNCINCSTQTYGCYCETCFPEADYHECTASECYECKFDPDREYFFNCKCSKCRTSSSSSSSSSSILVIILVIFSVIIVIVGIVYCIHSYYINQHLIEGNNNQANNNRNNNQVNIIHNNNQVNIIPNNNQVNNNQANNNVVRVNNNNNPNNREIRIEINYTNSNENILRNRVNKEITLEEILKNYKYLGPKLCEEKYQKFDSVCSICLEKFKNDIDMVSFTPCFHLFHHKCIKDYFIKNNNAKCPNCNLNIINYYKKQT